MNIESERIKKLRNVLGVSQNKFAKLIGVNPSTISLIENGGGFSVETAKLIVKKFNISFDWLIGEIDISDALLMKCINGEVPKKNVVTYGYDNKEPIENILQEQEGIYLHEKLADKEKLLQEKERLLQEKDERMALLEKLAGIKK